MSDNQKLFEEWLNDTVFNLEPTTEKTRKAFLACAEIKDKEIEKLKAERDGVRSSYEKLCEYFDDLNVQNNYHANQMIKLQAERKEMAEILLALDKMFTDTRDMDSYVWEVVGKVKPLIEKLKQSENNNDRD